MESDLVHLQATESESDLAYNDLQATESESDLAYNDLQATESDSDLAYNPNFCFAAIVEELDIVGTA